MQSQDTSDNKMQAYNNLSVLIFSSSDAQPTVWKHWRQLFACQHQLQASGMWTLLNKWLLHTHSIWQSANLTNSQL